MVHLYTTVTITELKFGMEVHGNLHVAGGASGISNVVEDPTPELGGNLNIK